MYQRALDHIEALGRILRWTTVPGVGPAPGPMGGLPAAWLGWAAPLPGGG